MYVHYYKYTSIGTLPFRIRKTAIEIESNTLFITIFPSGLFQITLVGFLVCLP